MTPVVVPGAKIGYPGFTWVWPGTPFGSRFGNPTSPNLLQVEA